MDFDQLRDATDSDAVVMRELLDLYFQQAAEIMAGLDKAIKAQSAADANHLAHKLAGSSLACGMRAVAPPLRAIEIRARAGSLTGAEESYALAANFLVLVREKCDTFLNELKS